jgi:glycosyltransferase involved in cell wall biosynthesis
LGSQPIEPIRSLKQSSDRAAGAHIQRPSRGFSAGKIGRIEIILNNSCEISIVIPAYNESTRLGRTLDRVLNFIRQQGWDAEVIVVDDGSRDRTADLVREYAQNNPIVRLIQNPGNHGKGYSVRSGMLSAQGAIVLFTDADLSAPIEEAPKLLAALAAGADIAIGSRWVRSELQTQRQSLARQVLGRTFNLLLRMLLRLEFKDTQCGFKAFRRSAAKTIFPLQRIEGWGFDPEILFLAGRMGFEAAEVPVVWAHDEGTRINPVADGSKMVLEMVRIRWSALTGKYGDLPVVSTSRVLAQDQRPRG